MTHPHEGDAAGTQPAAPPGDPDLDVFHPAGGRSVYLPADRVRSLHVLPAGGPVPDQVRPSDIWPGIGSDCYVPYSHGGTVTVSLRADVAPYRRALQLVLRRLFGLRGRHAPNRALWERADRHRRNARGFVPGAHPAARPMHEAYRARRRRRSGRR